VPVFLLYGGMNIMRQLFAGKIFEIIPEIIISFFRREALGRYYIHFTEDNLNRILPPTGVIPISSLQQGIKVLYESK
jgi:hypothetical protein